MKACVRWLQLGIEVEVEVSTCSRSLEKGPKREMRVYVVC